MLQYDDPTTGMAERRTSPPWEEMESGEERSESGNNQALPTLVNVYGYFEESESNTWALLRQVSKPGVLVFVSSALEFSQLCHPPLCVHLPMYPC